MPLREVSDINARYAAKFHQKWADFQHLVFRLDAVQDLLNHPTFESAFMEIAKGLPDLERIVSRIHAKNCKIKDFLKVLAVSTVSSQRVAKQFWSLLFLQSFRKLSKGLNNLADESETFESKTILGLLRSAPNLSPNIKNVEVMYKKPTGEKGTTSHDSTKWSFTTSLLDADELVPQEGKDEVYDKIMAEIEELEETLEDELKKLEKKLGYDHFRAIFSSFYWACAGRCPLSYWHSAQGNKVYEIQTLYCLLDTHLLVGNLSRTNQGWPKEYSERLD